MSSTTPQIKLFNTLSKSKEDFVPLDANNVRMYVCGPTVYDYAHIGNARPAIVFDVLFRLLRHVYGKEHVTYVRNITDVDDKINARAARDFPQMPLNKAIQQLTGTTQEQYQADMKALGCLAPSVEPRATDHIAEMVKMIEVLIEKEHAYVKDGHVLFDVKSFRDGDEVLYGKLARRTLKDMIAGARVEVAPYKRDPMDFVLWKPSANDEPGWQSPWGRGRPGWHIECSAMSKKYLGETFDIHGGGIDLSFPHHENELAQSCCANNTKQMAQVWMHNGFLQIEGEKMSKSEGNFVTVRELLLNWNGEPWAGPVVRFAMLKTHYQHPIDWTLEKLVQVRAEVGYLATILRPEKFYKRETFERAWSIDMKPTEFVLKALSDNLNVQKALSNIMQRAKLQTIADSDRLDLIQDIRLLGIFEQRQIGRLARSSSVAGFGPIPASILSGVTFAAWKYQTYEVNNNIEAMKQLQSIWINRGIRFETHDTRPTIARYAPSRQNLMLQNEPSIDEGIAERLAAIAKKNWAEADRIRDELASKGIQLMDYKDPETGEKRTKWEVKR